jgi:hypothetical protein
MSLTISQLNQLGQAEFVRSIGPVRLMAQANAISNCRASTVGAVKIFVRENPCSSRLHFISAWQAVFICG